MDLSALTRQSGVEWWIEPRHGMHVPGVIYATADLVREMDEKAAEQVANVASLPGTQRASSAMPVQGRDARARSAAAPGA